MERSIADKKLSETTIPISFAIFDSMEQCCDGEVERLLPLVSAERRQRALAYKHLPGRYACLKSYAMLCQLLRDAGIIAPGDMPAFGYGPHEKPFLRDLPGVEFSISHCSAAIAVAICGRPIGIDIERYRTPSPSLLRYAMNEQEQKMIKDAADFTTLWTQKEAIAKLSGRGLTTDLHNLLSHKDPSVVLITTHNDERQYVCTIAYDKGMQAHSLSPSQDALPGLYSAHRN